jgi:hypothetical protein
LNFQHQKSILNQYLPHSESESYSSEIFSYDLNLTSSEEFIQYSRTFAPQVQTPSPNTIEPSPCTPPRWELSKDTKNRIWSISIQWIL